MVKDRTKFAYAVARIRVLEDRMVDEAKMLRMIDAADFEGAHSVLNETQYAELFEKLKVQFDFEELFRLELRRLKGLLDRLSPSNSILESLWYKYDIHNIKFLLKAKVLGIDIDSSQLFTVGNIDLESLKTYVLQGSGFLSVKTRTLIGNVEAEYKKSGDPETIDILLDKEYFSRLKKVAELNAVPFFVSFVRSQIDLANIKIFVRVKVGERAVETFKSFFIEGGTLSLSFFSEVFDKSLEDFAGKLRFSPYGTIVSEGIDFYLKEGSFVVLEKFMGNYLLDHLRKARRLSFGIEPLIGYMVAKESEIKTLRLIFRSKLEEVGIETIKQRAVKAYV